MVVVGVDVSHEVELVEPLVMAVDEEVCETKRDLGGETIWSELITPGTDTFPRAEKDLSLGSSFHNRIWPSHEPDNEMRVENFSKSMMRLTRNEQVGIGKCCERSDPTWCLNRTFCCGVHSVKAMR